MKFITVAFFVWSNCVATPPPKRRMMVFDTEFPEDVKSAWHPRLVALVNAQKDLDIEFGKFTPNLDYELYSKPQIHYEDTPMGRLTLDRKISFGRYTSVFSVRENSELIIKYQSNCGRTFLPHPLLFDHWGLREGARANVPNVPAVYFVSPAVRMPRKRTTKCGFGVSDEEWERCNGSSVRFIVMEKFGVSLEHVHRSSQQAFSPRVAAHYGIQLMETLKQLHMVGIVHGDIHMGNLLVDKNNKIKLIDFDRFRFQHPSGLLIQTAKPFSRIHPLLSPWEIEGFLADVRDDIYRAVSVIAELVNPRSPYYVILEHMRPDHLYSWKLRGMLFSAIPTKFIGDNWGVTDPEIIDRLRQIFTEILFVARTPEAQTPNTHDLLIAMFRRVEWILSLVTVS